MLSVMTERADDLAIVKCRGRIVRGQEIVLESAVLEQKQARIILLDLSDVEALDAGGLTLLVSLHAWALSANIELKLVNPQPFVHEMLTRTRLDHLFEISTFDSALAVLGCECRQAHAAAC